MCPYNQTDTHIHGFIGTHQPAVWMGESGPAQLAVGLGNVVTDFEERGLRFERRDEYASANYYRNLLGAKEGNIEVEMTASELTAKVKVLNSSVARRTPPVHVPPAAGLECRSVRRARRQPREHHHVQRDERDVH